jgi:hypothetical protein
VHWCTVCAVVGERVSFSNARGWSFGGFWGRQEESTNFSGSLQRSLAGISVGDNFLNQKSRIGSKATYETSVATLLSPLGSLESNVATNGTTTTRSSFIAAPTL